ncbi:corticotropin-releasing factor-binding protein [Suricata suricatta]|uniref:corticotropin-releasing factor-binding protein n=1 Tax=Suricata suricatta TaxID=37032 RepID=UPI00115558D2|nr:corticotropin-releasing factor-binding protein [Suricata suricatta]
MTPSFKLQGHFVLIFLMALRGESRYLELREAADHDPLLLLGASLKRELAGEPLYRRALRESGCGRASARGSGPRREGRGEPGAAGGRAGEAPTRRPPWFEFPSVRSRPPGASRDLTELAGEALCSRKTDPEGLAPPLPRATRFGSTGHWPQGGMLRARLVFDGWILKGEKFPSSQDHPLPTAERYTDFCDSGLRRRSIRSSQNVAMIFFRVREPGNGFTVTIKTDPNLFPCNVISQTPNGRFTLVVPHLHRNCSFSIIYPVVIKISDLTLGHLNGLQSQNPSAGCGGIGDFVELLGGTGLDPSKMMPLADLCYSFHGPAQMKIGCDNTVVRMVSSGKHINRVTFEYRQLEPYELENPNGNSIQEICLPTL